MTESIKAVLNAEDKALSRMYKEDLKSGLSTEDEVAYQELIAQQRQAYESQSPSTPAEVRKPDSEPTNVRVRGIGSSALHTAMVVHSTGWRDRKD